MFECLHSVIESPSPFFWNCSFDPLMMLKRQPVTSVYLPLECVLQPFFTFSSIIPQHSRCVFQEWNVVLRFRLWFSERSVSNKKLPTTDTGHKVRKNDSVKQRKQSEIIIMSSVKWAWCSWWGDVMITIYFFHASMNGYEYDTLKQYKYNVGSRILVETENERHRHQLYCPFYNDPSHET